MNSAQQHLDKFLKENPIIPRRSTPWFRRGMFSMDRALQHLRVARAIGDKAEKDKELGRGPEPLGRGPAAA